MRSGRVLMSTVLAVCASVAADAQQSQNTVLEAHRVTPKAGMRAQLEAGRVKHMAWHKQQGDTWAWHVWEVITGRRRAPTSSPRRITSGRTWTRGPRSWARATPQTGAVNLAPYQASSSASYWVMLADAKPSARAGRPAGDGYAHYVPRSARQEQPVPRSVEDDQGGAREGQLSAARHLVLARERGPPGLRGVRSSPRSMAEMALTEPSMRDVVETALGRSAGEAALDAFSDAVESVAASCSSSGRT